MSQDRCTLQVKGLDCPNEVGAIRAALEDQPGVIGLGFDLIHGMMTVDYTAGAVDPGALARRITERTGMPATVSGQPQASSPSWWSLHERWVLTIGSGLALALGMTGSWLGPALGFGGPVAAGLAWIGYALAVVIGGVGIFPRAVRNL